MIKEFEFNLDDAEPEFLILPFVNLSNFFETNSRMLLQETSIEMDMGLILFYLAVAFYHTRAAWIYRRNPTSSLRPRVVKSYRAEFAVELEEWPAERAELPKILFPWLNKNRGMKFSTLYETFLVRIEDSYCKLKKLTKVYY